MKMLILSNKTEHYKTFSYIKMGKKILTFGNIEIEKKNLPSKDSYFLEDVDIEKLLVSNKISLGEKNYKYFIGYFIMVIKLNH